MNTGVTIDDRVSDALRCPVCRAALRRVADLVHCDRCPAIYPIVQGIPILINEANSVFTIADYTAGRAYEGAHGTELGQRNLRPLRRLYYRLISRLQWAHLPNRHFGAADAVAYMVAARPDAEILVIGAGGRRYAGRVSYTDVAFGMHDLTCICDGHDLPFADRSFDGVVAAAVLEHVMHPARCVQEMERVLRPDGYVYAITPFLQPVHMRAHDFTRFTYLGHRRLFHRFDDIHSGICGGPGSALAVLVRSVFTSMSDRPRLRALLRLVGLLVSFPLMYLDLLSLRKMSGYDAACGVYFFGKLRSSPLSDREILGMFRGG